MTDGSITRLLRELEQGDPTAPDRLFARVYDELKAIARAELAGEQGERDSGELVHDAYVRMSEAALVNRKHLFFAYARQMRQILVERARRANADKRGGGRPTISLLECDAEAPDDPVTVDPTEVDALLQRLHEAAPREAEVVTLRYFGGLSDRVIGEVLGIDARTVRRDWASAKQRLVVWAGAGEME